MAKQALITGGAGFIGSHLAGRLKEQGRTILLVDDLSTGIRSNIEALLDDQCSLIESDMSQVLCDSTLLRGVDEIYHLAATVGVKRTVDDPLGMIRNNIDQTRQVLHAAARAGATVLIASSSEVYGKCPQLPLRENMDIVYGPTTASRWTYGLTKALDERMAIDFGRRFGLQAVIVRLFNTIGPRQVGDYGMVVPRFIARAIAEEPIEVYGDGTQIRTFCDVRDVTEAMIRLMATPQSYGQIFNLGTDCPVSINQLAHRVLDLSGSSAGYRLVPYEQVYGSGFEDPSARLPDLDKISQMIGFSPQYSLDETLTELIDIRRRQSSPSPAGSSR